MNSSKKCAARPRSVVLGLILVAAPAVSARAGVLSDIGNSISSLWHQKERKQDAALAALSKARATAPQVEYLHDRLERTQQLLSASNASYHNYFRQMRATEARIIATRARAKLVEARYQTHRRQFGQRLAAMQRHGQTNYLQVTLGSRSFSDLTRRTAFFQALTRRDSRLQTQIKADKAELLQAQNQLMSQWQTRNLMQKSAGRERQRIAQGQIQQAAMWRQLNSSRLELLRYAQAQRQSSQEIVGMIGSLEQRKAQIVAAYEAQVEREREFQRVRQAQYQAQVQEQREAERSREVYQFRVRQNQNRYARRQNSTRYARGSNHSNRAARNYSASYRASYRRQRLLPHFPLSARPQFAPRIDLAPRYAPRIELAPMSVDSLRGSTSPRGAMPSRGGRPSRAGSGWTLPARGRLSSGFGMRFHPILHRERMHTGDDIAASYGSPIRAAKSGRVLWSGWKKAYGNTVIVDVGGGMTTLYGHASKLGVRAGQPIAAGEYIGNVGSTGFSTGPHLHFEVRKNGRPIDPTRYLRGR